MMSYAMIALAAVASILADRATPAPAPVSAPIAASSSTQGRVPVAAARPTNYCVVYTPTGSHLRMKTCRTRAEWLAEGFDPLKPND